VVASAGRYENGELQVRLGVRQPVELGSFVQRVHRVGEFELFGARSDVDGNEQFFERWNI